MMIFAFSSTSWLMAVNCFLWSYCSWNKNNENVLGYSKIF